MNETILIHVTNGKNLTKFDKVSKTFVKAPQKSYK